MKSISQALKLVAPAALVFALASCGSDEPVPIEVPVIVGTKVLFVVAEIADNPERQSLYVADSTLPVTNPYFLMRFAADERVSTVTVSPDGRYLGSIVTGDGTSCPAVFEALDANDGKIWRFANGADCLHSVAWGATGTAMAMRYTPKNATGASLVIGSVPGFESSLATVSTQMPSLGSVGAYAFSGDGQVIAWVEDSGLFVADDFAGGQSPSVGNARSTDLPTSFQIDNGGTLAVYVAPGETRFRVTDLTYGAAQSSSYLTAALTPGDTLGAFALSANGTHLLYRATIGGQEQLWLVALAAPLGEQRVDSAAPVTAGGAFAFNTSGTRFAWIGEDANPEPRVFSADVATPTIAVAQTPTTESVASQLAWTSADAMVYDTYEGPTFGNELRSVAVTAPLATVTLSDVDMPVPGVDALTVCSDGTVVYRVRNRQGLVDPDLPSLSTDLHAVQAMDAFSARLLAFTADPLVQGIGAFACE